MKPGHPTFASSVAKAAREVAATPEYQQLLRDVKAWNESEIQRLVNPLDGHSRALVAGLQGRSEDEVAALTLLTEVALKHATQLDS